MFSLPAKTLLALLPFYVASVAAQASGTGTTTRYWDCCKPSCAWPGKTALAAGANPVSTCDISGSLLTDYNAASGCNGGTAFMPAEQSPWAIDDSLAYGFAAVNIAGGSEESWCCGCYELTFTSGAVAGKKMIVQATNTGGDLGSNQFDIAMPGGGVGIFNGCTTQWGAPSSGWGQQYGGISSRTDCDSFPAELQAGCRWRFDFFENADNPTVSFKQVTCPAALTAKTGCVRAGEVPTGDESVSSTSSTSSAASVTANAGSSSISSSTKPVELSSTVSSTVPEVVVPSLSASPETPVGAPSESPSTSPLSVSLPVPTNVAAVAPASPSTTSTDKTTTLSSTTTTYITITVRKSSSTSSTQPIETISAISTTPEPAPTSVEALPSSEPVSEPVIFTTVTVCPEETTSTPEPVTTVTVYNPC